METRVSSAVKNSVHHVAFIRAQLKIYDVGKGFLKRYVYSELDDIARLRKFADELPNIDSDRVLATKELYQLFDILIESKTIPTHLSHDIFTELKKWFGLELIKNLLRLKEKKILTPENFDLVMLHHNPHGMTEAILYLQEKPQINTLENRQRLKESDEPQKLVTTMEARSSIFDYLKKIGIEPGRYQKIFEHHYDLISLRKLLEQVNGKADIEKVLKHANPVKMASAFLLLQQFKELNTPENREAVEKSVDPEKVAKTIHAEDNLFSILVDTPINTPENKAEIKKHPNVIALNTALGKMRLSQLTQENFLAIARHTHPISMASAIQILEESTELNTPKNFELAKNSADPEAFFKKIIAKKQILLSLSLAKIDSVRNVATLEQHPDLVLLKDAIDVLKGLDLLDDQNFEIVRTHPNPISMATGLAILTYANKLIGMDIKEKLDLIQQEDDPKKIAMALVVERVMGYVRASSILTYVINTIGKYFNSDFMAYCNALIKESFAKSINFSQNTHVRSVHKSASESAERLLLRYKSQIILETQINEIKKWSLGLTERMNDDNAVMFRSAQLAIEGLTNKKYFYSDPISKISLKKLLVLSWFAIHDKDVLTCDLVEAERLFIEGLYEIERGDNLDEKAKDDGAPDDNNICKSGAFNKLIEKLSGIHPDAEIIFMTPQTATWKLPAIVKEEIFAFLGEPKTQQELDFSLKMIQEIEMKGVTAIWDHIKDKVSDRVLEEFGSLFQGKADPAFKGIVSEGVYTQFDKVTELKKQISKSVAFRDNQNTVNNPSLLFRVAADAGANEHSKEGEKLANVMRC